MTTHSIRIAEATRIRTRVLDGWSGYLLRRAGGVLLSAGVLVVAAFLIVPLLPGDPAIAILGTEATPESIAALRERLGLDDPMIVRFGDYLWGLLHLDLGDSFRFSAPVASIIAAKLPYTLNLAVVSILVVLGVSVPLGMAVGVATRGGRRAPLGMVFGAVTGFFASVPGYVTATLLVVIFSIGLGLLPPGGATSPNSIVLPVAALALGPASAVARVVRQETHTVIQQDFMRTARGHRLGAIRLYVGHALPNLLTSTLTLTGLILAGIIGGAVIIESVFNYPGIGSAIVAAIIYKDYPVVQGIVLVIGTLAILLNLGIDILLGIIDPRTLGQVTGG